MSKVECDPLLGGTVWIMRKGKTDRGVIFSEDRQPFNAPNFSKRFTPSPEEVEVYGPQNEACKVRDVYLR